MLTISLSQIRAQNPCAPGWKTLLKHLGKTQADDEQFPFSEIVRSNGLDDALWALRCLKDEAPARLIAVAYAQDVLRLMPDRHSRDVVMYSHLYAYGECAAKDLSAALAARAAAWAARDAARAARDAAWARQTEWLIVITDNYEAIT